MFRRIFRFIRLALTALLLVLIVMFAVGRLRGATVEQQRALDLLSDKPVYKAEENLAPYIWLVAYDVPNDQIPTIAKSDAEKFNALNNVDDIAGFRTQAQARFPYVGYLEEELAEYCKPASDTGCVAQVERDRKKLAPLLRANLRMIDRAERIQNFRVHYSAMEFHLQSPVPKFNAGRQLLLVHYAEMFLAGQQEAAAGKVCNDLTFWRSIGANSDSLIASMLGHAYVRTDMQLLAEMLGRMESDAVLPHSCALAFAPVDYQENMICKAMQGEFGMHENLDFGPDSANENISETSRFITKALLKIAHDKESSIRKMAPVYARACSSAAVEVAKRNESLVLDFESSSTHKCDAFDWVSNGIGCFLIDVGTPDLKKYPGRRLDQSAQITAMQILLWLREKKVASPELEKMFTMRPDNLKAFSDRIKLDINTGTIRVDLLSPASDGKKTWSLPLPPDLLEE